MTTRTSTKLGRGPSLMVTPYIPDLHHFSDGSKDVIPFYRDSLGTDSNITNGLLATLSEKLEAKITAEDLLAYVYALGGTAAFSERFNVELSEAAGPIRIPVTAEIALFWRAVKLGRDLMWWHTWGERFAPGGGGPQANFPQAKPRNSGPWKGCPTPSTTTPKPRP